MKLPKRRFSWPRTTRALSPESNCSWMAARRRSDRSLGKVLRNSSLTYHLDLVLHACLGAIMKFHAGLTGLLGMLVAVPVLAGVPGSPQQVQPLSVGARAPIFAAR